MPELPEVETIARGLAKRVSGDVIESVWLSNKKEPFKSAPKQIAKTLADTRILDVRRVGKHIVIDLQPVNSASPKTSSERQWIVHLGMTGRMLIETPDAAIPKHTHAIAKLTSGRELRFVDPRRFGRLSIAMDDDFTGTGLEPLEVDRETFIRLFRGRQTPIKSALLNQKLLGGVGNIYADEALFRAGIRPRRRAASLTREQLKKLNSSLRKVLNEAICLGGSSISDYVNAAGEEGFFQMRHRVYGRAGEACMVCKTPIKRVVIAGRSSHYCPRCQK